VETAETFFPTCFPFFRKDLLSVETFFASEKQRCFYYTLLFNQISSFFEHTKGRMVEEGQGSPRKSEHKGIVGIDCNGRHRGTLGAEEQRV